MDSPDDASLVGRRRLDDAGIHVRTGRDEDVDPVATMVHRLHGGDLEAQRASVSRVVARRDAVLTVALREGKVIGYGKAAFCEPSDGEDRAPAGYYLAGLLVDAAWRRRGVGVELTRRRTAWAWSRGESAWCFANAGNTPSIDLHTALGFVEIGRAASYLGEPFEGGSGVLMRADPPALSVSR